MVALDGSHGAPGIRGETARTGETLLFALLIAARHCLPPRPLSLEWRFRRQAAGPSPPRWCCRVSSLLVFVAALMAVEPADRLLRSQTMRSPRPASAQASFSPSWQFRPFPFSAWRRRRGSAANLSPRPSVAYCILTASILAVMLFSAHPGTRRFLGGPAWRAMQRIATSYFWLVFALTGIGRLIGPHRPDYWHGFALLLLVGVAPFPLCRHLCHTLAPPRCGRKSGVIVVSAKPGCD